MRTRVRQTFNALLVGGVVVFAAGCGKGVRVFWPTGPERQAESAGAGAVAPEPASPAEPLAPAPDAATGGFAEGAGREGAAPEGTVVADLPAVLFDFDSAELGEAARGQLDRAAEFLAGNPKLGVVLRGHTDSRGTEEYNLSLGSRRAQAVRDYLIGKGIGAGRLETVSYGKMVPLVEGGTAVDEGRNRRVEFFVFELEKP